MMFTKGWLVRVDSLGAAVLLFLAGLAQAAPVDEATALQVARNFIANHVAVHGSWNGSFKPEVAMVEVVRHEKVPVAYNVNVRPGGHVLVAYDDDFSPVLLYSDTSAFVPGRVNEVDSVESWIIPETFAVQKDLQKRLGDYLAVNPAALVAAAKSQSRSARAWAFFNRSAQEFSPLPRAGKVRPLSATDSATLDAAVVGPLLATTWNQGNTRTAPFTYNLYTPADSGCSHAYTGCVATATAQIMKYWNWPDTGTGSHSYTWTPPSGAASQTLSASFSHAYNWSSMPNALSSSSTSAQIDAVARLMSDVGIANNMAYGCDGSGANTEYSGTYVLPTYFKYQNTVQSVWRSSYTAPEFFTALKAEFDAVPPRPVLFRMSGTAGGHAIVADGYQTGTTDMVHVNMGWGGSYDGYYDIANNWTTGSMTWTATTQAAFTHIQPSGTTTCSYTISPSSQSAAASGLSGTVSVSAASSCSWTATSNASWITVNSGASGTGNGTVSYAVAANTGTSQRSGTLTIAGQTFTVTQAGTSCSYAISPTTQSLSASASSALTSVTASTGCAWTAASNTSWLTISSGASGSGNGTVSYAATANTASSSRNGTLTIAGQTLTVTQAGASCSYLLTPASQSVSAAASSGTVSVAAGFACSWSATSNTSWITISSGASGLGEGTVSYAVTANTSTSSRSGTLTIAGQTFTVTQSGAGTSSTNFLNPGFENGRVSWTESGTYDIITNDATLSYAGNWLAWLGGYDSASDTLYQDITLPASATQASIQFWYKIWTEDLPDAAYDTLTVTIENPATSAVLSTQTLSNLNTSSSWAQSAAINVSAYVGQTIRLRFRATTDFSYVTSFFIDDVSLNLTSGGSGLTLMGTSGSDTLTGGTGDDALFGLESNDTLTPGTGNNIVYGGTGTDTLVTSASSSSSVTYRIVARDAVLLYDGSARHVVRGVETLNIGGTSYAMPAASDNIEQDLVQIYVAAFARAPALDGYNYWKSEKASKGINSVADTIFSLDGVKAIYPATMSNEAFVSAIFLNVFGRAVESGGLAYWTGKMATGTSRGKLVLDMTTAALGTTDGTNGKAFFNNRVDVSKYAVTRQSASAYSRSVSETTAVLASIDANAAGVVSAVDTIAGW